MLWTKAFHIIAMTAWFSGLFYLPRLFVYHSETQDKISQDRFKIMEKKLYWYIMTPAAIITIILGLMLTVSRIEFYTKMGWLHTKLFLVMLLILFHIYLGFQLKAFAKISYPNINYPHSSSFYRKINEIPTVLLTSIVLMVVLKPF